MSIRKLTQIREISAYALICVRDRSDRDCREHIYIELGTRPNWQRKLLYVLETDKKKSVENMYICVPM